MDTRTLELFLHLADSLSFSRTAEHQHLSPSAVSRSVQRIEDELGQRLFERDKRSVRLTAAGRKFQQYAQQSLADWQAFAAEVRPDRDHLRGAVSVYGSVTASYSVLSPVLERFRLEYPGIEMKLHTGDQADAIARIQAGNEDIGVAACPDKLAPRVEFLTLLHSPLRFIAPKVDCAVRQQLDQAVPRDWSDIPFIMAERGLSRERLDQWFRVLGKQPKVYAQVAGHEAIAAMVGLGLGVGVIPELVLENSTYQDKLEVLAAEPALGDFPVGLCALKQRLENPLVAAFWSVAQRSYAELK